MCNLFFKFPNNDAQANLHAGITRCLSFFFLSIYNTIKNFHQKYSHAHEFTNIYKTTSNYEILKFIQEIEQHENLNSKLKKTSANSDPPKSSFDSFKNNNLANYKRLVAFSIFIIFLLYLINTIPINETKSKLKESKKHRKYWKGKWIKRFQKHHTHRQIQYPDLVEKPKMELNGVLEEGMLMNDSDNANGLESEMEKDSSGIFCSGCKICEEIEIEPGSKVQLESKSETSPTRNSDTGKDP